MSSRPSSLIIEATDDDTKDLDWISDHVEDIICLIYRVEYALQLTAKTQALRMYALSRIVTQGITKGSKSLNVPNTLKVHGIHGEFVEMFFVSKSRRMW
jgi:predicted alpha/beta-fold hydrolase